MPSNDDKLKALSEAIQRGLEESKELQEEGALEIRQMEENVRTNISAIGDILKAELSKKPQKAAVATEILIETPEESENTASDDSLKSKILELGSILHSALTTAKPVIENIQSPEPRLITEPVEEAIVETVIDFDEEKAQENISNNFAKIADLIKRDLKKELVPERPGIKSELKSAPIESKQSEEPNISKNNIINNYVNILDKISKDTPTEAKEDKNAESELSPSVLKYINEQVTALRVQIGHAMESGGGTVAQQFAAGGTMNGSLDVRGQILSGGTDIATFFGGSGNAAVNSIVIAGSANWNNTYTTVNVNSGTWGTGGTPQTLSFNSTTAGLSITNGNTVSLSTLNLTGLNVTGTTTLTELIINGGGTQVEDFSFLSVSGSSQLSVFNTIQNFFTGPSASSDIAIYNHNGVQFVDLGIASTLYNGNTFGPTFNIIQGGDSYLYNSAGNLVIGSSYEGAGDLILFAGRPLSGNGSVGSERIRIINSNRGGAAQGFVGINVSSPNEQLTINGNVSSNSIVYANGGDSTTWNNTTTNLSENSAKWEDTYTTVNTYSGAWGTGGDNTDVNTVVIAGSANWNDTYTTVSSDSANWTTAYTLATGLTSLSSNWQNTYTTTNANSANWTSVYTTVNTNSANYALTNQAVTFSNNVTINGNLTALGTTTLKNTIFSTTSALSVVNAGTGPALYVYQAVGPYDVASFYDGDGVEVLHVGNANAGQGGKVGINESFPTTELTVRGSISASGYIVVSGGNSNQWNTSYSNVNSNSGRWENAYTATNANSANWNTAYTLATGLTSLSSNWQNTYTTTNANSANWNTAYTLATGLTSLSSNWQNTYTTVNTYSGAWGTGGDNTDVNSVVIAGSANWNGTYTTVYTNSASWGQPEINNAVNSVVIAGSANWNTAYTLATGLTSLSSNWQNTYTTTNANSANWNTAYTLATGLTSLSSNWQNTYTTTNANSANWTSVYTTVNTNSANYALTNQAVTFTNNVTINGNLTALGTTTLTNTIFSTTSALSVFNAGTGPALYVYQAAGPYDVASFYDGDGIEVLHVGNAGSGGNGKVGINESFPTTELTVRGSISANGYIAVSGGNSNQWNTAYTLATGLTSLSSNWQNTYTTTNANSANWNTAYTLATGLTSLSSNWQNTYTTVNTYSGAWGTGGDNTDVNTVVIAGSANWNGTYTTVNTNSGSWGGGSGLSQQQVLILNTFRI